MKARDRKGLRRAKKRILQALLEEAEEYVIRQMEQREKQIREDERKKARLNILKCCCETSRLGAIPMSFEKQAGEGFDRYIRDQIACDIGHELMKQNAIEIRKEKDFFRETVRVRASVKVYRDPDEEHMNEGTAWL